MLAEPKRRTVWSLNPRGKQWSEDKTKFGQKLLESMGWKEGLGLGRDQNGIKEHIKVTINSENKGLGYKPTSDDVWIDCNGDYEQLLANLALHHNNGSNKAKKVSNLEEMSKKMRNRVHYSKLIKAKNLSQCSEKDLNSIIPKRRDFEIKRKSGLDCNGEPVVQENSSGNTFKSGKSIDEYFRNKMKEKLKLQTEDIDNEEYEPIGAENSVSSEDSVERKDKTEKRHEIIETFEETKESKHNSNKEYKKKKSKKNKRKIVENISNSLDKNVLIKEIKSESNEKIVERGNDSKKIKIELNDNSLEGQSNQTIEVKEVMEKGPQLTNGYSKKLDKKAEKNIEKYKIRVPKGYDKLTASVNESLRNYPKICAAIAKDSALSTSNLMALKGYGCDTD